MSDTSYLATALSSSGAFCQLMADARGLGLPGAWSGSAYRHHPCGVIRLGLIFTNEWNVNNYCSIRAMNNPDEAIPKWCQSPAAHGDPSPRPPSGTVTVWREGKWIHRGPWEHKAEQIVQDLLREIEAKRAELSHVEAIRIATEKDKHDASMEALRLAHGGGHR